VLALSRGSLFTWISPPSKRVISREMERPSPVPPYLRLVVPSACWNASKMIFCLLRGMPMPVSVTRTRGTVRARCRTSDSKWLRSGTACTSAGDAACSVNLNAFESRFLSTCWQTLRNPCGCARAGLREARSRTAGPSAPPPAEGALEVVAQLAQDDVARLDLHLARLPPREIEISVDQREGIAAARVGSSSRTRPASPRGWRPCCRRAACED